MENRYKIDQYLVCLPGLEVNEPTEHCPIGAGSGYKEGLISKIDRISEGRYPIYWYFNTGAGVYEPALREATPEEVFAYDRGIRNIKDIKYTESYGIY